MHYVFDLSINDRTIKARAFTFKEFQNLVAAKERGELSGVVVETINECTGLNALELSTQEAEYVFLMLWCNSLAKMNFNATWHCDVCDKEKDYHIDITKTQITEAEPYILDLGEVKINFRQPKFTEDSDIMQMIIKCIDYIIIGNEQFDINDLNAQDFDTILNMITQEHVENIIYELTKNQIILAVPVKCECGEAGVYSIKGLSDFLKIV